MTTTLALLLSLLAQAPSGQYAAEEAKLVPAGAAPGDEAGISVALHGDTAVVGAHLADHAGGEDAGAVYVWVRSALVWSEQAALVAGDAAPKDSFGGAVALDGDTLVVGAALAEHGTTINAGAAYVFVRSGTVWSEQAVLSSGAPAQGYKFGHAVAVDGDTVVVGETQDGAAISPGSGTAYVFVRSGTTWSQQARLDMTPSKLGAGFGFSVAIEGRTVVVGADRDGPGAQERGSAHVFERMGTTWTHSAKLAPVAGGFQDHFGWSVAIAGDALAVGACLDDVAGMADAGSAYVFRRAGSAWNQEAKVKAADAGQGDYFGISVALEGDQLVCGASGDDVHSFGQSEGSAYVFERSGSAWTEVAKVVASDGGQQSRLGTSASRYGDTLVLGARFDDGLRGAGYVFHFSALESYCTAGTSGSGCSALLAAAGTPSATAGAGFTLSASSVEGSKDGMFFFGTSGRQAKVWGNGSSYQCVAPPVSRAGSLAGTGTNGVCDGAFAQDLNALWSAKPAVNPGAGAVVQAQLWYRDPLNTSNQTTSLSDAVELVVKP